MHAQGGLSGPSRAALHAQAAMRAQNGFGGPYRGGMNGGLGRPLLPVGPGSPNVLHGRPVGPIRLYSDGPMGFPQPGGPGGELGRGPV